MPELTRITRDAAAMSGKRSLALREFALGVEGLERFVQRVARNSSPWARLTNLSGQCWRRDRPRTSATARSGAPCGCS
jgi:hypothetical protein